jgi:hypothetical protein
MFKKINIDSSPYYTRFLPIRESFYAFVIKHESDIVHIFLRGSRHTSYLPSGLKIKTEKGYHEVINIYTSGLLS